MKKNLKIVLGFAFGIITLLVSAGYSVSSTNRKTNNKSNAKNTILLPKINLEGMSVFEAMERIGERRRLSNKEVSLEVLSEIFWAAHGEVYSGGNVTKNGLNIDALSGATNKRFTFHVGSVQEFIKVYYISKDGVYLYKPETHSLTRQSENNLLNKVDGIGNPSGRICLAYDTQTYGSNKEWAYLHMGMVAQNIYLTCASNDLFTASQGVFRKDTIASELNLPNSIDISLLISFGNGS